MKKSSFRWVLLVLGILLVIVGVILFATPGANSAIMAYVMCILMLVYGIAGIVYYIANHKSHVVSGWLLADGIISTILSILLLCVPGAKIMTMTIIFAVWVLFTGATRISAAFVAKDAKSSGWGWILAAGILGVVVGIWFMFDPMLAVMAIGYLLPITFIVQGISAIAAFFATNVKE